MEEEGRKEGGEDRLEERRREEGLCTCRGGGGVPCEGDRGKQGLEGNNAHLDATMYCKMHCVCLVYCLVWRREASESEMKVRVRVKRVRVNVSKSDSEDTVRVKRE